MLTFSKLALVLVSALTLASASPAILPSKRGVTGVQINCKPGYFALTYDDGPYEFTEELVDKLNGHGIKATFFVNGNNWWDIKTNKDATAAISKAFTSGHQIASHTYTHADLDTLTAAKIKTEMQDLEKALSPILDGKRPAFMRPPYGNSNVKTTKTLNLLGYTVVTWNVDSKDYVTHNLTDEITNYKTELGTSTGSDGGIALEHDVYKQTVEELTDAAISYVQSQGYEFATVAECFNADPYQ